MKLNSNEFTIISIALDLYKRKHKKNIKDLEEDKKNTEYHNMSIGQIKRYISWNKKEIEDTEKLYQKLQEIFLKGE